MMPKLRPHEPIGRRIAALRGSLSRPEFAERIRFAVSPTSLPRHESGARYPSPELIDGLVAAFDCTADWILRGEAW